MKDHNDYLPMTLGMVDADLELLKEQGYRDGGIDASLNYLHFLRDEVNKRIKAENKKRKAQA